MLKWPAWYRCLHRQQRATTCAVAAVRTVLHYQFGVRVTESALIALATRPEAPILREGSGAQEIRRMVRGASQAFNPGPPWTLRVRRHGTLLQLENVLKRHRWPIVWVPRPDDMQDHVMVVLAVEPNRVLVFDPDPSDLNNPRWLSPDEFLHTTQDVTWYAVINGGTLQT